MKVYRDRISGHKDDRLYHSLNTPDTRHIAVEFDNKATWYATVYAVFTDFIERRPCIKYLDFSSRAAAETWACRELCGSEPCDLRGDPIH